MPYNQTGMNTTAGRPERLNLLTTDTHHGAQSNSLRDRFILRLPPRKDSEICDNNNGIGVVFDLFFPRAATRRREGCYMQSATSAHPTCREIEWLRLTC